MFMPETNLRCIHVCAYFVKSSDMMISNFNLFVRPVSGREINGRENLNDHNKQDNCNDKSNYSKLHDRERHITISMFLKNFDFYNSLELTTI